MYEKINLKVENLSEKTHLLYNKVKNNKVKNNTQIFFEETHAY